MKLQKNIIGLLLSMVVLASACKKDDDAAPSSDTTSATISSVITSGTWKVSLFRDDSHDHTADFNGYTFTFNSNGTATASGTSGTTTGSWHVDDSNASEFHLSLGNTDPLHRIDKGWIVTSAASNEVHLQDDSGSDEVLHFTKI